MTAQPDLPEPVCSAEQALVALSHLPADASLDAVFRTACELSADVLQIERVGVWLLIDDGNVLRCAHLFERSRRAHSAGAVLRVADFPDYFASLEKRKSVPAEAARVEPWTSELTAAYLEPLGITSMLDAGIFVDGRLVGVVCHEHVGEPRDWAIVDRAFAGSVADVLALRIQTAEVHELRAAFRNQQKRIAIQAKAAALEELSAGIAHDLKNLLTTFRIYGKLLSQRPDLPADAREQAKEIYLATERGDALAKELMDFARPAFAPPTIVDLADVTAQFIPALQAAAGKNRLVQFSPSGTLGRVLIEETQFRRLLMNVVQNAAEAMPDGGTIAIRVIPVRHQGNGGAAGRYVMVEVVDSGAGMDQATLQRVFEPYFTTKSKGTGLGMPIVRQILDRVGGFVRVESQPAQGTSVRMYFPAIRSGNGPKAAAATKPDANGG